MPDIHQLTFAVRLQAAKRHCSSASPMAIPMHRTQMLGPTICAISNRWLHYPLCSMCLTKVHAACAQLRPLSLTLLRPHVLLSQSSRGQARRHCVHTPHRQQVYCHLKAHAVLHLAILSNIPQTMRRGFPALYKPPHATTVHPSAAPHIVPF